MDHAGAGSRAGPGGTSAVAMTLSPRRSTVTWRDRLARRACVGLSAYWPPRRAGTLNIQHAELSHNIADIAPSRLREVSACSGRGQKDVMLGT